MRLWAANNTITEMNKLLSHTYRLHYTNICWSACTICFHCKYNQQPKPKPLKKFFNQVGRTEKLHGKCIAVNLNQLPSLLWKHHKTFINCSVTSLEAEICRSIIKTQEKKYTKIACNYHFHPIVFEKFGSINHDGTDLLFLILAIAFPAILMTH